MALSEPQATWTMDAAALCRVAGNVAHVHKKNATIRSVLFTVDADGVTILGGDPYAAAYDWTPAEGFKANRGTVRIEIPREGLDAVTSFCRQHPKQDVVLSWFPGDGLVLQIGSSREAVEDATGMTPDAAWRGLAALFERYEDPSSVFVLDMGLTSRFRLVKSDKSERRAAWMIRDPEEPILVKYGPYFRGLMVPIKLERHAEAVGQDGLW
jgi:hypothetical protein